MEWVVLVVMLAGFTTLYWQGGEIMANIDDLEAKIGVLEAKVDEAAVTLAELKAIATGGGTAEERIAAVNARLDAATAKLAAAETDADPTPDV